MAVFRLALNHLERVQRAILETAGSQVCTGAATETVYVGIGLIQEIMVSTRTNVGGATDVTADASATAKSIDIKTPGSTGLVEVDYVVRGQGK